MTKALVIGYGSIGRRHVRLLTELGCEVAVVSRRQIEEVRHFADIADAVITMQPDYAVIANETASHVPAVNSLAQAGFTGALLIEKPLGGGLTDGNDFALCAVAYNLRFHPAIIRLIELLRGASVLAMQVYCGQYLPNWRPGTDYRTSYSAHAGQGGGVLRDLSHEIDLLLRLGGPLRRIAAIGGRFGTLEISSDDCWGLLVELERCRCATLQINYLDRPGRREIVLHTGDHTYCIDFGRSALICDGKAQSFEMDRDATYLAQHRAMLTNDTAHLCSLAEASQVMDLIAAAERAASAGAWVAA